MNLNLSVRAYNAGRKYGLPSYERWDSMEDDELRNLCIMAAEHVMANNLGKKATVELFRAGGLGTYNIALRMLGTGFDFDKVKEVCGQYDSNR